MRKTAASPAPAMERFAPGNLPVMRSTAARTSLERSSPLVNHGMPPTDMAAPRNARRRSGKPEHVARPAPLAHRYQRLRRLGHSS